MKKVKFSDGSYTVLAIKSDLFAGEGDGVFDPDGNLLKARIRFPSGLARAVTRHGAVWKEIQAIGEIRTTKKTRVRRPLIPRPLTQAERRKKVKAKIKKMRASRLARGIKEKVPNKEGRYTFGKRRPKAESGTYRSFGAWASAVRRAGGTPNSELSEPQGAFNRSTGQMVGEWDGREGMVIRKNPIRQRIDVSLNKARRNPFPDRNADE